METLKSEIWGFFEVLVVVVLVSIASDLLGLDLATTLAIAALVYGVQARRET
jgi:hypothetical protein